VGVIPGLKDRATIVFFDDATGLPALDIEIDCTTNEQHGRTAKAAQHPVAKGIARTDSIRPDPTQLVITGFFGNIPADVVQFGKRLATLDFKHAEDTYQKLEDAFTQGWLATVKTSLKTYDDMALLKFDAPRAPQDANSITITMTFGEVRTVVAQTGAAVEPKPKKTADGKVKKVGAKAQEPTKVQSAASKLSDQAGVSKNFTLFKATVH
jgi:hypothetical protein